MSRVGKKPVPVPKGVTAKVDGQTVAMKGPKGELSFVVPDEVAVAFEENVIRVEPRSQSKRARAMWGTARAQISILATGVTSGFSKTLEINGVGYKAALAGGGKSLQLSLGYSHDITYPIPAGITVATPKPTEVTISGSDKRQVGQVASEIRAFRSPEPYKGKGVKYAGEFIFRKEGKKK